MKIILKLPCHPPQRTVIELRRDNFGELQLQVASRIQTLFSGPFEVSLNGKDSLKASDETSLSSLGLVSGDIVQVIATGAIIHEPGPHLGTSHLTETGGFPLYESQHISIDPAPSNAMDSSHHLAVEENSDCCLCPNHEVIVRSDATAINKYLNQPVICQEANEGLIPSSLEQLYRSVSASSTSDVLVLAIHSLMAEAGFQLMDDQSSPSILTSVNGVYKLRYYHPVCCSQCCQLVSFVLGNILTVHGLLPTDDHQDSLITVALPLDQYVQKPPTRDIEPRDVYKNLPQLSQQFKDEIVRPLLRILCSDAGIRISDELMSLPVEVKLRILWHLDVRSLLAASQTCTELNELAKEEQLWKHLSFRDFDHDAAVYSTTDRARCWRLFYKTVFLEQLENKRRRLFKPMRMSVFNLYRANPPPMLPTNNFMPSPLGIIGGNYDRFAISSEYPRFNDARPNLRLLDPRPRRTTHFGFCPRFI